MKQSDWLARPRGRGSVSLEVLALVATGDAFDDAWRRQCCIQAMVERTDALARRAVPLRKKVAA